MYLPKGPIQNVTVLVPAHNEGPFIAEALLSLQRQMRPANRILVVADNCTDNTVAEARRVGCEVYETVNNKKKKAGGLNQALAIVMPDMDSNDIIVCMDADTELSRRWIRYALEELDSHPLAGAVSAAYFGSDIPGILASVQRIEYAADRRRVARRKARVNVLSGTATAMRVGALRQVAARRGKELPGIPGEIYFEDSLTEDYELTLALKTLGYQTTSPKNCIVTTDVMSTFKGLVHQRIRWQRGTLETLKSYGWTSVTRPMWREQFLMYAMSLFFPCIVAVWVYAIHSGHISTSPLWFLLAPLASLEGLVIAWRVPSRRVRLTAAAVVPMYVYDLVRAWLYWIAMWYAVIGATKVWHQTLERR